MIRILVLVSLCVTVLAAPAATDVNDKMRPAMAPSIDQQPRLAVALPSIVDCDPLPQDQLDPLISSAAIKEGLQPELVRALILRESAFKPCVVSPKGAQGLMQLMPDTAEHFGVLDPFDPKQNIDAGAKFLKQLVTKYNGDLSLALGAYNGGVTRVDRDTGVPAIPETVSYVSEILSEISKE